MIFIMMIGLNELICIHGMCPFACGMYKKKIAGKDYVRGRMIMKEKRLNSVFLDTF